MKSQNAVLYKLNGQLKINKFDFPNPSDYQVLVKLFYSGICGSQLMEISGGRDNKKYLPHFLGHEGSGIVIRVGKKVRKVKQGDKVILSWLRSKGGGCKNNKILYKKREINYGPITTFGEYTLVAENKVVKKPKRLSNKIATLFGCAIPTGAGMVLKESKLSNTSKILVFGLGGVGFSTLITLLSLKIRNISILEKNKNKILIAKKLGIKSFLNKKNIHKFINNFDYCFESCGKKETIEKGFELIKNNGKLIFSSHPHKNQKINLYPHDLIKGKKIVGSWGGSINLEKDLMLILNPLKNKLKLFNLIINKTYELKDLNKAIRDLKKGKTIRPLIKF